jgi:phosphatidylserine decarboxylase
MSLRRCEEKARGGRVRHAAGDRFSWPVLVLQGALILAALVAVAMQLAYFPFPSPLTRGLLPPQERYPTQQVMDWVESGVVDPGFVAFFNRDPERTIPPGDNFVAPADGVVKAIDEAEGRRHFVVGLSFWDVHVVRSPMAGVVRSVEAEGVSIFKEISETADMAYLRGKAGPVQQVILIENEHGLFKLRLVTSYWASRIKVWAVEGQEIAKGERVGRMLLGSSVVLDLPQDMALLAEPGERVVAGESVIVEPHGAEREGNPQ